MSNLLVVPGQVIAVSHTGGGDEQQQGEGGGDSFLRGHGTYVEISPRDNARRLVASVVGTVVRVNKLVLVESAASKIYHGHVGDLVVGRIASVGNQRWSVELTSSSTRPASLPLSGVHLPGFAQRIRTAQDAREMRSFLREGDLVSAEVHKVQQADGSLSLHTRSTKHNGKLENGCAVVVPPSLVPRLAQHSIRILDEFDVLLGCNGRIWMQRKMPDDPGDGTGPASAGGGAGSPSKLGHQELAEWHEKRQRAHREMPYSANDRKNLARLRNSILVLGRVRLAVSPDNIRHVYVRSRQLRLEPNEMLRCPYANVFRLTEALRRDEMR